MSLAALLGVLAAACTPSDPEANAAPSTASTAADFAFVNVHVIPMDRERVLRNQTVLVRDGRIVHIGPAGETTVPGEVRQVDGSGKYLMPGLSEMHAHIPSPQAGEEAIERTLFLYLAGGVTTVRGMLGHPRHLELREQAARDEILSPRIYTSGPSLNGNSASTPRAAVRLVEEQKAAGYDFLKIHPGLSRESFEAMVEASHRLDMPFAGHVSSQVGLHRALESGQATIDHLDSYAEAMAGMQTYDPAKTGLFGANLGARMDEERIARLAEATREAGVWNVPTQSLMEHLVSPEAPEEMAQRPELRYMPPQTVQQWMRSKHDFQQRPEFSPAEAQRYVELRRKLIKALHEAGAGLLLGSDAPQWWNVPGFSVQRELEYLVASGLTPYQALETGTRNPAVFFGAEQDWGTLTEGRSADLILLDANPLQDIANLSQRAGVMVRGRWLPQAEIQKRLNDIAAAVQS